MKNYIEILKEVFGDAFLEIADDFIAKDIKLVNVTIAPQRGFMMEKAGQLGIDTYMTGGGYGQQLYPNVKQFSQPVDIYGKEFGRDAIRKLVSALPKDLGENIALATYDSTDGELEELTQYTGASIVATDLSLLRPFFEEKANLKAIMESAGLQDFMIPSTQRRFPHLCAGGGSNL